MNDLVINHNGILATTQDKVSILTDNNEHSIQRLIRTYKSDLECFGAIEFKNVLILNSKNTKNYKKIYYLNEQQATLLLTYMKNTQKVREAKKLIVEAFYKMKAELTRLKFVEQSNRIANLEAISISKDKHHAKQISGYKAQLAKHNEQIKLLKAKLTIAEDESLGYDDDIYFKYNALLDTLNKLKFGFSELYLDIFKEDMSRRDAFIQKARVSHYA